MTITAFIIPTKEEGVIVGTSKNQEWLLPWWWMHYRLHNDYPVTFVNFGDLSPEAVEWCSKRGHVVDLELTDEFMAKKEAIDPSTAKIWEAMHPAVWGFRFTWYKKPFALLLSPYKRTVWIDLDCQVRGSIKQLFTSCRNDAGFAAVPEHEWSQQLNLSRGLIKHGEMIFNAGVVAFTKESKIIEEWAKQSREKNHLYCSDQQLLAHVLFNQKLNFTALSPNYNWTIDLQFNKNATILHWWGSDGKIKLKSQIEGLSQNLLVNLSFVDDVSPDSKSFEVKFN